MPYCPSCRTEYQADVDSCSECGVALVPALEPEKLPTELQWVRLASFGNEVEGRMLVEALEDQAIRTMLKSDVFASAFGSQGTSVFVPRAKYERAEAIRQQMFGTT